MSETLKPRILRFKMEEQDAGKTIKEYLMRGVGFSSKQLSRFKYRRDGILLNGEKRYVNAILQKGDVLEIRLTQGGEPVEEPDERSSSGMLPRTAEKGNKKNADGCGRDSSSAGKTQKCGGCEEKNTGGYVAARDGRLQKIWVKPADWLADRFPLKILYEDQDILAADKPSGVVCHPSPGHFDDTLSNQVAEHLGRIGQELDVRVTGRLDKDTSGIVVFALNTETAAQLIKQRQAGMAERFSFDLLLQALSSEGEEQNDRTCRSGRAEGGDLEGWSEILRYMTMGEYFKLYIARVRGHFGSALTGTVDRPLRRESRESFRMIAADDGKEARTHYAVLRQLADGTSLIACRIEHGRTHQIRVHMSLTGHPIVGDRMYGPEAEDLNDPEDRTAGEESARAVQNPQNVPLMLHAYRTGFRQPFTGETIRIEAPLPGWAQAFCCQTD